MSTGLERYVAAERMLAEIQTMDDADAVMRLAEAARVFAERERLGTAMVNHATAIKLKAGNRLIELYEKTVQHGGDRRSEDFKVGGTDFENPIPRQKAQDLRRIARAAPTDADIDRLSEAATRQGKPVSLNRILRQARDEEAAERREQEAEDARDLPTLLTCELRIGDFREVLAALTGVDAIITDPPYGEEFIPLLGDLARFADQALVPDGVLAVLYGQTHIPAAYMEMDGGRSYRWTMAYLTPGSGYVSHARRVQSNWKPVLVYGGGPRLGDVVESRGDDKRLHEWGQDLTATMALVERLTAPGALVCDPFTGGGTTAFACRHTGRRFIGCDVDETAVLTTRSRIEAAA